MATPFFDRRLFLNSILTLLGSALILYCIRVAIAAHLPYLVATILATTLGFLEPRKGWFLALIQAGSIWIVYMFFLEHPTNSFHIELENFGLYGSMILSFVGSFVGGRLKRILDSGKSGRRKS
ncbi:hypothetical protein [Spirosoma foliorum]|uniref:Uncharacterized protein n=1 Tax=Spirosoma foliorum TaxID=2710596 RepID=A0A7G5GW60_9BACT|nr:hypothetical protein [Spirosoma foliorum]QMW03102.1 hypothetical protein H3H32_35380 [Spirosoma foliorum]